MVGLSQGGSQKDVPAIVLHVVPLLSLQQQPSAGMSRACQVTPRCQPWRSQRGTQKIPATLGKHSPPPRTVQHQLSTGMPRACRVTPGWHPWRCQRVTANIPHMWGMPSPPPSLSSCGKASTEQRVRVKQHLQVRAQAHLVHLRECHEKDCDGRHARQWMWHRSVAESIKQDRARFAGLAAAGSNVVAVMMGAAPKQRTAGLKTFQAFVDGHWQLQFTVEGGLMWICSARVAQTDCPGVKRPLKADAALDNGTYGIGMRMMMAGPKIGRKDVM